MRAMFSPILSNWGGEGRSNKLHQLGEVISPLPILLSQAFAPFPLHTHTLTPSRSHPHTHTYKFAHMHSRMHTRTHASPPLQPNLS